MLKALKPKFWDQGAGPASHRSLFNYRRLWLLVLGLMFGVSFVPLALMAGIDFSISRQAAEQETELRMSQLVSNTRRTISYFIGERVSALGFIAADNTPDELADPARLATLLELLKSSFSGFVDLGVIGADGVQLAYVGPFELAGKDYSGQEWFSATQTRGRYVSEVFQGYRGVPHLVVAVRRDLPGGTFLCVRATLDTATFNDFIGAIDLIPQGDAFIINREGVLQTPSRSHGDVLDPVNLPVPPPSTSSEVIYGLGQDGSEIVIGYAYIEGTPFVLMIVKPKTALLRAWYGTRIKLSGLLAGSVLLMVLVFIGVATVLVGRVFEADQRRATALHQAEHAGKLASIGRLAAGVAHEINNPLAIINEKAGLLLDLFTYGRECNQNPKLKGLVDSIITAVERCGAITRRLLSFARHMDVSLSEVDLPHIVHEVLGFLGKEAEYRSIAVDVMTKGEIPRFISDRGKLQQIFLNLVNNAFAAMSDGGHLTIAIRREDPDWIAVTVADDGCGIPEADLKRIFEPFFTTRKSKGGTGLGLSITYGLVQDLGGRVEVDSHVGQGTTFVIHLPLAGGKKEA